MAKKDKTNTLPPNNFERMLRLAPGLTQEQTIALMKALQAGLGGERLYTQHEVQGIVNQALAHQQQRQQFFGSPEQLQQVLRGVRR